MDQIDDRHAFIVRGCPPYIVGRVASFVVLLFFSASFEAGVQPYCRFGSLSIWQNFGLSGRRVTLIVTLLLTTSCMLTSPDASPPRRSGLLSSLSFDQIIWKVRWLGMGKAIMQCEGPPFRGMVSYAPPRIRIGSDYSCDMSPWFFDYTVPDSKKRVRNGGVRDSVMIYY